MLELPRRLSPHAASRERRAGLRANRGHAVQPGNDGDNIGCRTAEGEPVLWRPGLPFPYVFSDSCYSCPTFEEASGEMIVGSPMTFDLFGAEVRTGTQCYTIMRWKPSLPEVVYLLNTGGLGEAAEAHARPDDSNRLPSEPDARGR